MSMTRTLVKASSVSLLYGVCTKSRQVKRCCSRGTPPSRRRLIATAVSFVHHMRLTAAVSIDRCLRDLCVVQRLCPLVGRSGWTPDLGSPGAATLLAWPGSSATDGGSMSATGIDSGASAVDAPRAAPLLERSPPAE